MTKTPTLCDVLPSAAALLDVPGAVDRLDLQTSVGDVRRVVVVVVDGMGWHLLPALAQHAPFVASVLAGEAGHLTELTSTFPSTTPTSLVSLGTGVLPGEHGVLGFTVNMPGTDRVLTHIFWRDEPDPRQWQPVSTWYERVAANGAAAKVVLPAMFAGSGLTDAAYRGAQFCGVAKQEDYAARLLAEVRGEPGLVYGYTAALDTAAHLFGIDSDQWRRAGGEIDALLSRIADELPPDAALLVTADHGGLDIPAAARVDLAADPRLSAGLRAVAGEPRVRYLHTVDGAADDVVALWRDLLGERADVFSREQAIDTDMFGPVPAAHRARIGDVVVICRGATAVLATGWEPPQVSKLVGMHGAATAAEMAIPLFAYRR